MNIKFVEKQPVKPEIERIDISLTKLEAQALRGILGHSTYLGPDNPIRPLYVDLTDQFGICEWDGVQRGIIGGN